MTRAQCDRRSGSVFIYKRPKVWGTVRVQGNVPRENLDVAIEKATFKASASAFALHNLKLQVIRLTTTTYNTHNGINISSYAREEDAA
jgi:hypothetical protein